jgi:DNA repair protein RadD
VLELRNYQKWAIHHAYNAMRLHRRVCLACPTGSGKRIMAVHVCMDGVRNYRNVLIATNRRLLVDQMAAECNAQGVPYGVIMADTQEGDPRGPVQVASIQTLQSWYLRPSLGARYGYGIPEFDLLIVDECHAECDRYLPLLALRPQAKCLGLTATPVGAEGCSLVPRYYDALVEGAKNTELIAGGFLLPTRVFTLPEPNLEGVKVVGGKEYNPEQTAIRIGDLLVYANVFNSWLPYQDRKTICFVPSVQVGQQLEDQFNFMFGRPRAHLIHAKTPPEERSRILDAVGNADSQVLISVDVLREGFDLPVLSCLLDLQPNNQLRSYWQKLGRIKRVFEGQSDAVVLDAAGNYWKFPHPNEDPIWPEGEETTQEAITKSREEGEGCQPIACPGCHAAYAPTSRPPKCPYCGHVIQGTPTRTIHIGDGRLKEIPAYAKRKVEKSEHDRKLAKWQSALFAALHSGMTYGQTAVIYKKKTGESPRGGWPGVFEPGSLEWKYRVNETMTKRDIVLRCKDAANGTPHPHDSR